MFDKYNCANMWDVMRGKGKTKEATPYVHRIFIRYIHGWKRAFFVGDPVKFSLYLVFTHSNFTAQYKTMRNTNKKKPLKIKAFSDSKTVRNI